MRDPWADEMCRNTVMVTVTTANGDGYKFTGFMLGPNAVATAGHCIFNKKYGGNYWVTSATVTPAYNTGSKPAYFGSADAMAYQCGKDWAENENKNDDGGIIILEENLDVGWLGLQPESIWSDYKNTEVWVNGYPEESFDMFRHKGTITYDKRDFMISGNIITYEGESGGPCYIYSSKTGYTVIGLLSGYDNANGGSRYVKLTKSLYNTFLSFRTSTL